MRWVAVVIGLVCSLPLSALSAELSLNVMPVVRPRTAGPVAAEVRMRCTRSALLEGRLEVEARDGSCVLWRYRSYDMALTAGDRNVRLLLPALPPVYGGEVNLFCAFVAGEKRWEAPVCTVWVSPPGQWSVGLAFCEGLSGSANRRNELEQCLRLDRYCPGSEEDVQKRKVVTALTRLAPEDMPAQPLAFAAYDVVALGNGGLDGLQARQRVALRRWVEAGGSLFVLVQEQLAAEQVEFLNGFDGCAGSIGGDAVGRGAQPAFMRLRAGLGRLVVAGPAAALDWQQNTEAWRRAVTFLWKVRANQAGQIEETGHWNPRLGRVGADGAVIMDDGGMSSRGYDYGDQFAADTGASALVGEWVQALMSRTARMIPFPAVVGVLIVFVVLIGPVDWWMLGWVKRRRYTWLLLPVVTAGIAYAMVRLADHYLGRTDRSLAATVVDIGTDGRVLRRDRYSLRFSGRAQHVTQECRDAIWAQLDKGADGDPRGYGRAPYERGGSQQDVPCRVEGVFPGRYSVSRDLPQWKPELTREFSMEAGDPLPAVQWEAGAPLVAQGDVVGRRMEELRRALLGGTTREADVYVFSGGQVIGRFYGAGQPLSYSILTHMCVPGARGVFSLVTQVSPSGGAGAGDTVVLDSDDMNRRQVAVVMRQGDEIIVQRRCYDIR